MLFLSICRRCAVLFNTLLLFCSYQFTGAVLFCAFHQFTRTMLFCSVQFTPAWFVVTFNIPVLCFKSLSFNVNLALLFVRRTIIWAMHLSPPQSNLQPLPLPTSLRQLFAARRRRASTPPLLTSLFCNLILKYSNQCAIATYVS